MLGYSQRERGRRAGRRRQGCARQVSRADRRDAARRRSRTNPELLRFAIAGGAAAFGDNCAPCHGRGAQGGVGYPNLNDDDWLWGGTLEEIQQTITHGIRSGDHGDARHGQMPRFGPTACLSRAADRRRRRICALAVRARRRTRPRPSAAPRSSPTTAPSATARTARAIRSSARRI